MREIILSSGDICLVDDADYERLSGWRWKLHAGRYAARSGYAQGKSTLVLMHRQITDAPEGMEVHHLNENRLDNRRANLQIIEGKEHRRIHAPQLVSFQKATQKYPDEKPCAACGKVFSVNPRKRKRHKTCSPECALRLRMEGAARARSEKQPSSPRSPRKS